MMGESGAVPSWVPYAGSAMGILFWGSFAVPAKAKSVVDAKLHPLWFQLYVGLGVTVSSLIFLAIRPDSLKDYTYWGAISAVGWVLANSAAMGAVPLIGIATAQSTWGAQIAIISFLWGILLGDKPQNLPLTLVGLLLLIAGILILAYVSSGGSKEEEIDEPLLLGKGDDDEDIKAPKTSKNSLGFMLASVTGVFAGSIFVPLKLAPSMYRDGLQTIAFAFSQGITTFAACLVLVPMLFAILYLIDRSSQRSDSSPSFWEWLPPHHARTCMLPAFVSGALWNMGNLGGTLASLPPLQSVGYSLTQSALLVACLWGVLYFKEITGRRNLAIFAFGALVTCIGLVVTGFFGQAKK